MKVQYLIIKSEVIDSAIVAASLQKDGYYFRYVNNTALALKSILKTQPFLILLDVIISKVDEETFRRIFKNDEAASVLKIFAFSDKPFAKANDKCFDSLLFVEGNEQVLIDGLRNYLTTGTPLISPIIFKKFIQEPNY